MHTLPQHAQQWRKSSRSTQQGQCVEVADVTGAIAVRDSKNADGPMLVVSRRALVRDRLLIRESGRRATRIVTVSETSRQDLIEL